MARSRGFALVLAIVLLAFLTLILTALVSLSRVESRVAVNSRSSALARQSAMVGLNRAMAELQATAGPDQRVTAQSGIITSNPSENRRWTGVWDSDPGSSASPVWLISGGLNPATFDPQSRVRADGRVVSDRVDAVVLVGAGTIGTSIDLNTNNQPDEAIVAQTIPINVEERRLPGFDATATTPKRVGAFGWWVGDEGVKARVNLVDRHSSAAADSLKGRARHRVAQRDATEAIAGLGAISINEPGLTRVLTSAQLCLLDGAEPGPAAVRARFHDATTHSAGVLADPTDGGLKKDLSAFLANGDVAALNPISTEFVASNPGPPTNVTMAYARSWANLAAGSGFGAQAVPREFAADGSQPGLHPVIVRHSHYFGVSYEVNQMRVHYAPTIVLWNPYDVGLAAHDYVVEVAIPFQISLTGPGISGVYDAPTGTIWLVARNVTFEPGESRMLSAEEWTPYNGPSGGAVQAVIAPGWRSNTAFFSQLIGTIMNPGPPLVAIQQPGPASILASAVRLRLGNTTTSPVVQELLASAFPHYRAQDNIVLHPPVFISTSTTMSPPALMVYWGMVAHGWGLLPSNGDLWTALLHETAPVNLWINDASDGSGRGRAYAGFTWKRPDPDIFNDPASGQTHNILWGVPRTSDAPILSVAEFNQMRLRSLVWQPRNLFDAGSGVTANSAIWDRYFMSGLSSALSQTDIVNPAFAPAFGRLKFLRTAGAAPLRKDVVYDGTGASAPIDSCAANLVVEGMFNVNSTSVDAWRALFSSFADVPVASVLNGSANVETATEADASPIRHPFSRFAFPARESVNPEDAGASGDVIDLQNSMEAWAGYRRLTDAQVNALAEYLASHVDDSFGSDKPAGTPFRSMASFVECSILSDAIQDAQINPASWTGVGGPPAGVAIPGVFTKWDLLARLMPVLSVRSDTFLIRTYGESINPVTQEVEGRAWCEATAQRIPTKVDGSDPITGATGFGRRFVITSFRWLSPDDI